MSNAKFREVVDRFDRAAFALDSWEEALRDLASACGARSGQLIGISPRYEISFNFITNLDPDGITEFAAIGGGDPDNNPRVKYGAAAPVMEVLTESDYPDVEAAVRTPIYKDLFKRFDVPFICQTTLLREEGQLVGLSVLRSSKQGHVSELERQTFGSLAFHVRSAVKASAALEGQASLLVAGMLESLNLPAFVCDRNGLVQAMTPQGEQMVGEGGTLSLSHGVLTPIDVRDRIALAAAIEAVTCGSGRPGPPQAIVVRSSRGNPMPLRIIAMPSSVQHNFAFEAKAVVIGAGAPRRKEVAALLLQTAYALTPSEAHIAHGLTSGRRIDELAEERAVSAATVRVQVKSIYSKVGVSSQSELAAKLAHYVI